MSVKPIVRVPGSSRTPTISGRRSCTACSATTSIDVASDVSSAAETPPTCLTRCRPMTISVLPARTVAPSVTGDG